MENIKAVWRTSLDCKCPGCKDYVDLMEYADYRQGRKRLEKSDFLEGDSDLQIAQPVIGLEVNCPKCGHEFMVDTTW